MNTKQMIIFGIVPDKTTSAKRTEYKVITDGCFIRYISKEEYERMQTKNFGGC